jgi:acyl carrier protein
MTTTSESSEREAISGLIAARSRDEILSEMKKTMALLFDLDPAAISLEARLVDDLDLDSIDAIDLAVKIQDLVGVRVDEVALRKLRTVGDVVDLIERMLTTRA